MIASPNTIPTALRAEPLCLRGLSPAGAPSPEGEWLERRIFMGTVSFEVPGPGTYQVTCDPKLNPLSNGGTAGDILKGKQFYNDQNQAVTGTLEPAAPTYAGVLVVTVDAGAEVTATDGATTLTAVSTGTATFYLPNGGTWTVSATLNGSQSSPAAVEVQENFSLALSAGASQTVTIPTQYEAELSFLPTYTVTLSVDPAGSGTVTGAGEYQQGAQAAVSAAAAEGYDFSKWTENGASRLPAGYQEIEYIESTGTQYIDTGFNPTTSTKVSIDLLLTDPTTTFVPFGAKESNASDTREKQFFTMAMGGNSRFEANYFSRTEANLLNLADYAQRGTLSLDGSALTFNESTASLNYTGGTNAVPYPMFLFGYNISGTPTNRGSMQLFGCQIWEGEVLVRNFVPCTNSTGDIGLYDLVGGAFYSNTGTEVFTAGPQISGDVTISTDNPYTFTVTEDRELTAVFEAVSYGPKEFPYTGNVEALILKPGRYKLETWGAQGGYRTSASYGGKGGYSVGILELAAATNVFVRVGGSGNSGGANGGFNGGGKRSSYPGGGGASDIRIGTDDLNHRVIVAGGGGSDGGTSKPGKYGGGLAGGNVGTSGSANGYGTAGYGGTQTGNSGGASWLADAQSSATSNDADAKSGFGFGGNGVNKNGGFGGAGGGGWYGGTGRIPDGSGDDDGGGGGGSGFVWTGENAPADFGLTEANYLKDAETIDGSKLFSAPDGTSETGHTGDGYVRITPIPPPKMYTITVLFGGNGTATGGGVFEEGTSVTVTATPNEGYKLSGWMENGEPVSTSKKYTFTADRNRTLTAEFVEGVDPRLPDGYTEVEYISNPNLTYIYIYGILSYLIEKSWEIEFLLPDTLPSSDFCIIGGTKFISSTNYTQNLLVCRLGTSTLDFQNYSKYGSSPASGNNITWDIPKVKSTFSFYKSSATATLNGISKTPVLSGGASNTCLFGAGGAKSVSYICDYKLFSFKILNNAGTAVTAEYVPAIRESDGAVGLFLLGSETTFLQSSVSGKNFEAGPPV